MRKKSEENPPKRVSAREPEVPDLTRTEAAWAKHEGEIRAMAPEGVRDARLDVTVAAAIAIAGVRNVLGQREALEAHFRDPPIEALERVEALALAAQHADLLHRVATDPLARYADLLPRANELRGLLLHDLGMQVRRKRAEASVEEAIRAGDNSVRDKANDLNDLAHWYRKNWSTVSGKTTVEEGEIAEAGALAVTLLARLGTAIAARPGSGLAAELGTPPHFLMLADRERIVLFSDGPVAGALADRRADGSIVVTVPKVGAGAAIVGREFDDAGSGGSGGTRVRVSGDPQGDARIEITSTSAVARVHAYATGKPARLTIDLLQEGAQADRAADPARAGAKPAAAPAKKG